MFLGVCTKSGEGRGRGKKGAEREKKRESGGRKNITERRGRERKVENRENPQTNKRLECLKAPWPQQGLSVELEGKRGGTWDGASPQKALLPSGSEENQTSF